MTEYNRGDIRRLLERDDVADFLDRRAKTGTKCVGKCGTVVPDELDVELLCQLENALSGFNLRGVKFVGSRFERPFHDTYHRCENHSWSFGQWVDKNNPVYSEEIDSVRRAMNGCQLVRAENGRWVLGG